MNTRTIYQQQGFKAASQESSMIGFGRRIIKFGQVDELTLMKSNHGWIPVGQLLFIRFHDSGASGPMTDGQ